jgi:hypothetical protein
MIDATLSQRSRYAEANLGGGGGDSAGLSVGGNSSVASPRQFGLEMAALSSHQQAKGCSHFDMYFDNKRCGNSEEFLNHESSVGMVR